MEQENKRSAKSTEEGFLSGFVALVGPPNTGKSTLLNALIGQKIAITANKPQTTRNQIRGILTTDAYQAIIVDTPGLHTPNNELHKRILRYAVQSLNSSDLVILVREPARHSGQRGEESTSQELIPQYLHQVKVPVVLALNKVDMHSQADLMASLALYNSHYEFAETYPISALKGKGLAAIEGLFTRYLPPGERLYHEDQITDQTERILAGELIREQIFRKLKQELPYSCAVDVEKFSEDAQQVRIYASIYVNRDSQKGIVLGKKGAMLKSIGSAARQQIERMLGQSVYLSLHIRVSPDWQNTTAKLSQLGYDL